MGIFSLIGGWKTVIAAVLIAIGTAAVLAAKSHYETLVNERQEYKTAFEKADREHTLTKQEFADYKSETKRTMEQLRASLAHLTAKNREAEAAVDELQKKLSKHDIGNLAHNKPGLVTNVINRATDRVFRQLELESGGGGHSEPSPGTGDLQSSEANSGAGDNVASPELEEERTGERDPVAGGERGGVLLSP